MIAVFQRALIAAKSAAATKAAEARRLDEVVHEIETVRNRLADRTSSLRSEAGKAALAGRSLTDAVMSRRRAEIADDRTRLEALEEARPLAQAGLRKIEAAAEAARRDLSALAIPALHRRRLEEAGKLKGLFGPVAEQLAAVKAIDLVQAHFAGTAPFVRQLPEAFYFSEPLVNRLVAAIAPQFLDDPLLSKKINERAKALAAVEIQKLEANDG